jgi:hypothetical protein
MSDSHRRPAYIAIARSFVKDLRYRRPANRPLVHTETLLWLIAEAAWKPRGSPTRFGAIHNNRSQLSTTHRALAKEWGWSKGKVARWLTELARDGTISVELVRCGAKSGANLQPESGYRRSLITLMNYDKFNAAIRSVGRKAGQKVGQSQPGLPGLIVEVASKPNRTNPTNKRFKGRASRGGGFGNGDTPMHGKVSATGFIFCRYGTEDWTAYATDFENARGYKPVPTRYRDGGKGNWFEVDGEALEAMA